MPATNYGWMLQDSTSMLHSWGSKRKHPEAEEPDSKRQCTNFICDNTYNEMRVIDQSVRMGCDGDQNRMETVAMETYNLESHMTENRVPELHPQCPPQESIHHPESTMFSNNSISQGANLSSMEENNNNNCSSSQVCCQNTMIMDLQDECYSTAILPADVMTDAEYEAACNMVAAMESEGAPDPYQYRYSHSNSSLLNKENHGHSKDLSQMSERLSFSPSQDTRPYCSDYY